MTDTAAGTLADISPETWDALSWLDQCGEKKVEVSCTEGSVLIMGQRAVIVFSCKGVPIPDKDGAPRTKRFVVISLSGVGAVPLTFSNEELRRAFWLDKPTNPLGKNLEEVRLLVQQALDNHATQAQGGAYEDNSPGIFVPVARGEGVA